MKAVIVEDEEKSIRILTTILETYCEGVEVVGVAQNALEAIKLINNTNPDVVFLDVEMPNGNGFDVLEGVANRKFHVVFTTAYNHYAIKALKFGAIDYVMKPISVDELVEAVGKVKSIKKEESNKLNENLLSAIKSQETPDRIAILQNKEYVFVNVEDIIYFKSEGAYTDVFTNKEKFTITKNLSYFNELLGSSGFYRIHNSYLAQLNKTYKFLKDGGGGGILEMGNGYKIPVSRMKIAEVKKILAI